jgi:hypothetical protein
MSKTPILAAQVWSLKVGLENKLGNLEACLRRPPAPAAPFIFIVFDDIK